MSQQAARLDCTLADSGPALRVWYLGWRDYWAGRDYPFRFDCWSKVEQLNYEAGRLYAANVRAAGLDPAPWGGARNGVGAISRLCNRSVGQLGEPVP